MHCLRAFRATPLLLATAIAALTFAAADRAVAQDASVIERIATYKGADREKMLIDGAKKEGTLTFYTTLTINQAVRPLVAGFEKKYPFVKVRYSRDNPPEMLQKLTAEARAKNYVTDVYESTGLEVPARKADINRPFWSPEADAYPADRKSAQGYYVPSRYSYLGVCYNTDLVKPADVPHKFEDLLDPKWKGKMAWSSTVIGSILFITGVRNFMGEEKAEAYLQKLAKQDVAPIASTNRAVVDRIIAGEYALCLDSFLHHPIISANKGAPVAPDPMNPVLTLVSSVMLPKYPPHPYAAMLFIDYLLSVEGQTVLRQADYFPARPGLHPKKELDKIVPEDIGMKSNFISPEKFVAMLGKSRALYQKLFVK
jgi:iron(III) transport system substrate-binding protein